MKTSPSLLPLLFICMIALQSELFAVNEQPRTREEKQALKRQKGDPKPGFEKRKNNGDSLPLPTGIWPTASLMVARTTDTTVDINIFPRSNVSGTICYRKFDDTVTRKNANITMQSGIPSVIHLSNLQGNCRYVYWLEYSPAEKSPEYSFYTQRAPGNAFQFIVQGDSHPERGHQNNPMLYAQALKRIALERPDFFIALGDDFSVDTLREITPAAVDIIYRAQREYLGFIGAFGPLFLVNGNHEQAARCNLDGTPNNAAVWAQNTREKYFSQPAPQGIYTGDTEQIASIGFLRDYYAWQWGDALFVVIDPYWHSTKAVDNVLGSRNKNSDEWNSTLGDTQYQWLKITLESSRAPFKFVFTHHVLGRGRGGIECASNNEWGGQSRSGAASFLQMRPGWPMPIHQLMVKNGVTIFFQGHDHLFCKQELDGVIYQTCPLPAGPADSRENVDAYRSGTSVPGSGFLRVSVQPTTVHVDFVKNLLPQDTQYGKDGDIAFSYQIKK
ncbi:MAG: metallophosphoesterase [bacterium]